MKLGQYIMNLGQRYIFYETIDNKRVIFEAEFIDIINDTIRVCMYKYLDDDFRDIGKMNNGMLTLPYSWIDKILKKIEFVD